MLTSVKTASRLLWRDLRSGEWIILFCALFFSVAAVTTLDFCTDRIKIGINQQSNRLLGGDLAIVSASAIPSAWETKADTLQLQHALVLSYPSVAKVHNQFQLVTIQAVSDNFPLFGNKSMRPALGTVWVEPRLLPLLSITLGNAITIGKANFTVARLLTTDSDMLNTGWVMAPRILMRLHDVPATNTILPGSRVEYRLLLTGNKTALSQFRAWITPRLSPSQRIITVRDQQTFIRTTLERTENYLQLVMLVCLVMSGVAIALSVNQYMHRHYASVALWRCLGMQRQQIMISLIYQLIMIILFAGTIGTLTGYLAQLRLSTIFTEFLPFNIPASSLSPVIKGFVTSTFLLFAFAIPIVSDLPNTSPLYLWRGEANAEPTINRWYLAFMLVSMIILLYWILDITLLTLFFIDIILFSIAVLYAINFLLLSITRKITVSTRGAIKRGLSNLIQHPDTSNLQFSGLTLILICLFMLGFIRASFLENWKNELPPDTPNYFVFNIAPDDIPSIRNQLKQHQVTFANIYPMVRGRLTRLNNKPIMSAIPVQSRGHNALHRELNLSWMWEYPSDNQIVSGKHWTTADSGKAIASIEASMAKELHLQLGDTLSFQIGDQQINASIVNLRRVDWASFHPNFYVIFPPGLIDKLPATYITSFNLPTDKTDLLNNLIESFPNITVIDTASILKQLQTIVDKITMAIQYLFLFSLGSGVLIMIISIQTSMDERKQTWRLIRILGASRRYITTSIIIEFGYLFMLIVASSLLLSKCFVFFLERNFMH